MNVSGSGFRRFDAVRRLVLDALSSASTCTMYGKALDDFFAWRAEHGNPPFNRAAEAAAIEIGTTSPKTNVPWHVTAAEAANGKPQPGQGWVLLEADKESVVIC